MSVCLCVCVFVCVRLVGLSVSSSLSPYCSLSLSVSLILTLDSALSRMTFEDTTMSTSGSDKEHCTCDRGSQVNVNVAACRCQRRDKEDRD
jgi:hypothetical protein